MRPPCRSSPSWSLRRRRCSRSTPPPEPGRLVRLIMTCRCQQSARVTSATSADQGFRVHEWAVTGQWQPAAGRGLSAAATATCWPVAWSGRPRPAARPKGVQVDLLAQADAERRDGPGGVVAAAVEAPVDGVLDAAAGRLDRCGDRQGRASDHQAGVPAQELTQSQDHRGVAEPQDDGKEPIGQRAADDAVDVVQPVAQDRRAGRQRQHPDADPEGGLEQGGGPAQEQRGQGQQQCRRRHRRGQRQPA